MDLNTKRHTVDFQAVRILLNCHCCCYSVTQSCPTLCNPMDCNMPSFPVLNCLLEFAQTRVHWVSDAIQPSHSLLSPFLLPSIFPSIRVFSSESALHITWPKYWSFSFSISPSNDYSGMSSFRIDWFDLLAVQGFGCWQLPFWYIPAEKGSSISIQCIWKN